MVNVFMLFLTWLPLPLQVLARGVFMLFFILVVLRLIALILDAVPLL